MHQRSLGSFLTHSEGDSSTSPFEGQKAVEKALVHPAENPFDIELSSDMLGSMDHISTRLLIWPLMLWCLWLPAAERDDSELATFHLKDGTAVQGKIVRFAGGVFEVEVRHVSRTGSENEPAPVLRIRHDLVSRVAFGEARIPIALYVPKPGALVPFLAKWIGERVKDALRKRRPRDTRRAMSTGDKIDAWDRAIQQFKRESSAEWEAMTRRFRMVINREPEKTLRALGQMPGVRDPRNTPSEKKLFFAVLAIHAEAWEIAARILGPLAQRGNVESEVATIAHKRLQMVKQRLAAPPRSN